MLVLLWAAALATSSPLGGAIHGVLLMAILAVLLRVIEGRYPCAARVLKSTCRTVGAS
jgi:hypothetical protein